MSDSQAEVTQALAYVLWLISPIPVADFQLLLSLLTSKILEATIMYWHSIGHVYFGKTSHYLLHGDLVCRSWATQELI
jgi:hypothetical protein